MLVGPAIDEEWYVVRNKGQLIDRLGGPIHIPGHFMHRFFISWWRGCLSCGVRCHPAKCTSQPQRRLSVCLSVKGSRAPSIIGQVSQLLVQKQELLVTRGNRAQ